MEEDKLEVSRRMFKHACAFLDCASCCQKEPNNIEYRMQSHTVAGIVNSAFACEVFIKSLLVYHGESFEKLNGHELKKHWSKYKKKDREKALLLEQGMRQSFDSDDEKMFDELLAVCSNAFKHWRYIYEANEGKVHILFLHNFALILRSLCCEEFYKSSWEEFKANRY